MNVDFANDKLIFGDCQGNIIVRRIFSDQILYEEQNESMTIFYE